MGESVGTGVELAVEVIDRLVDRLVESAVPLEREPLETAGYALLEQEAPLTAPGVVQQAIDALVCLGPIEALLREPDVSDILVNGPDEIWVERNGDLARSTITFPSAAAIVAAVERVISPLGLRLDRASPAVDARLADGSRLYAIVPPVSVDGPAVAVRRFTQAVSGLDGLVAAGSIGPSGAALLAGAVRDRRNLVVSGGTGSGKTTLLGVLSALIGADQRVVTVEDAAELQITGHVVRLESRPPNAEGVGAVTLRTLLRHALRLRPDRIIVGEVRGPEALDMLMALNAGSSGLATLHANSAREALDKLVAYCVLAGENISIPFVRHTVASITDIVVFLTRSGRDRQVSEIAVVPEQLAGEAFTTHTLFRWDGSLRWTGSRPHDDADYTRAGMEWPP